MMGNFAALGEGLGLWQSGVEMAVGQEVESQKSKGGGVRDARCEKVLRSLGTKRRQQTRQRGVNKASTKELRTEFYRPAALIPRTLGSLRLLVNMIETNIEYRARNVERRRKRVVNKAVNRNVEHRTNVEGNAVCDPRGASRAMCRDQYHPCCGRRDCVGRVSLGSERRKFSAASKRCQSVTAIRGDLPTLGTNP